MPAGHRYKEARVCECGYSTFNPGNWSVHKKSCKIVTTGDKERIAALERQLAAKDEQIADLTKIVKKMIEVHTPPPVKPGATKGTKRKKMTEPQRRKIAQRQNFKCANPDGKCRLVDCNLEEYDVDHVNPLFLGGPDNESNMQALCPACHRRAKWCPLKVVKLSIFCQSEF